MRFIHFITYTVLAVAAACALAMWQPWWKSEDLILISIFWWFVTVFPYVLLAALAAAMQKETAPSVVVLVGSLATCTLGLWHLAIGVSLDAELASVWVILTNPLWQLGGVLLTAIVALTTRALQRARRRDRQQTD